MQYRLWTKYAESNLRDVYEHISKDSPKNALGVVTDITNAVEKAATYPDTYAVDKLKLKNDGTYRAFEKHHYRVSYRYDKNVLRVLRVRHTKMSPKYH